MKTFPYIVATGPLAAGKTSLVRLIERRFTTSALYEDADAHPYLADFYRNMPRWAFHTAVQFVLSDIHDQDTVKKLRNIGPVCQDSYYAEHRYVYARHLKTVGC